MYDSDTTLAVGSSDNSYRVASETSHNYAEMYFHSTSSWKNQTSYEFHETIFGFQILAYSDFFILFGGGSDGYIRITDVIAKFNPNSNKWSKMGNLQTQRFGLGVIKINEKFLVMGGLGEFFSEECEIKNETIKCASREPIMRDFNFYPNMMIVSPDDAEFMLLNCK